MGYARQASYAVTNVALLFGYNRLWPGLDKTGWRYAVNGVETAFRAVMLPLGLLGALMGFGKRSARQGLLAMHLVALLCVAAIFFGETRLRVPYDAIVMVLGLDVLGRVVRWTVDRIRTAFFAHRGVAELDLANAEAGLQAERARGQPREEQPIAT